jgi:hypothetical protein
VRSAVAVLEDLLILIELTEFGARARAQGRERWAINCARRAVSTNVERLGPELATLRGLLASAERWLKQPPDEDEKRDVIAGFTPTLRSVRERIHQTQNRRRLLELGLAHKAVEAVHLCVAHVASAHGYEQVATRAREAFRNQDDEAAAQARRLLLFTKLLPTGADLLVRLDYVESLGRLPSDPEAHAWIEAQRASLMTDDEQARMAVMLRYLELVFMPELDRLH